MQTMMIEGLRLLGDLLGKGALEAAKEVVSHLTDGVRGSLAPETVLASLKSIEVKMAANHATEDKELEEKYHPAGSSK